MPKAWSGRTYPNLQYSEARSRSSLANCRKAHPQSYVVLEQAQSFVVGSASFLSYKHRIGAIIDPHLQLDVALAENDLNVVRDLLDEKFNVVASGPWTWLHELKDLSYSTTIMPSGVLNWCVHDDQEEA